MYWHRCPFQSEKARTLQLFLCLSYINLGSVEIIISDNNPLAPPLSVTTNFTAQNILILPRADKRTGRERAKIKITVIMISVCFQRSQEVSSTDYLTH